MRDIKLTFKHPESIDATAMKNKVVEWVRINKYIDDSEFLVIKEIFEAYETACKPTKQMRYRVIESKIDESLDIIFEDGTHYYYYFDDMSRVFGSAKSNTKVTELIGVSANWSDEIIERGIEYNELFGDIDATTEQAIEAIVKMHKTWDTEMLRDDSLFTDKIDNYKNLKPWKKENA